MRLGLASKILSRWRVALPLPDSDLEVDWVSGASMMIRREVFADVGEFDETFFLYFEETDFCLRAKKALPEVARVKLRRPSYGQTCVYGE